MAQVSTSLDSKRLAQLDRLAASLGLSRSAALRLLAVRGLDNAPAMLSAISTLSKPDTFSLDPGKIRPGPVTKAEARKFLGEL